MASDLEDRTSVLGVESTVVPHEELLEDIKECARFQDCKLR